MRLYSTVTSERASKGQGGNKYLDIKILNEKKEEIMDITLQVNETKQGDLISLCYGIDESKIVSIGRTSKGKQKKDECKHEWRQSFPFSQNMQVYCIHCGKVKLAQ